jgi:predicted transcriptional regulator
MVGADPCNVLTTLVSREAILYAVDVTGCDKREITEAVSTSRSTVNRSIRELEQAGLVGRGVNGYRRTLLGELLLSEYYRFKSQTAELLSAGDVFASLPPEIDIDGTIIDDATIITASQATPHEPISQLCELLAEASEFRMYASALFPSVIKSSDQILPNSEQAEVLLTDPVLSQIVSKHGDKMEAASDMVDFYLAEQDRDTVLVSLKNGATTQAAVLVLDDSRQQALIKNSGDAAVEWVNDQLDSIARTATPLGPDAAQATQQRSD